jgi:hypothetical protein
MLHEYIKAIDQAANKEEQEGYYKGLSFYILRTCYPKIHTRIAYHSRCLRPPLPGRKKEKVSTKMVDYTEVLILDSSNAPGLAAVRSMFAGHEELDGIQTKTIEKIQEGADVTSRKIFPTRSSSEYRLPITAYERRIFDWVQNKFNCQPGLMHLQPPFTNICLPWLLHILAVYTV